METKLDKTQLAVKRFIDNVNDQYDLGLTSASAIDTAYVLTLNALFDDLQTTKAELDRANTHLRELQREVDDIPKVYGD